MTHTFPGLACSCSGRGTFSGNTTTACLRVRFERIRMMQLSVSHDVRVSVRRYGFARLFVVFPFQVPSPFSSSSKRVHRCRRAFLSSFRVEDVRMHGILSVFRAVHRIHVGVFVHCLVSHRRGVLHRSNHPRLVSHASNGTVCAPRVSPSFFSLFFCFVCFACISLGRHAARTGQCVFCFLDP